MRVVVDEILCAGHGVCEEAAPQLFSVGEDGIARVLIDEFGEELKAQAILAVQRCPAEAITLVR